MSASPPLGQALKRFLFSAAALLTFAVTVAGGIQYFKVPSVRTNAPGPLTVSYAPRDNLLEFSFDLTLDNTGYGSEVIGSATAQLVNRSLPADDNSVPYGNEDIFFLDGAGGAPSPAPFTIDKESAKKVRCFLRKVPGGISRAVVESAGQLELSLNLFGKRKYLGRFGDEREYAHRFCFDLNGADLRRLGREPQKFFNAPCR